MVGGRDLQSDTKGQAIQIGAILLFGLLIISLTFVQATVVPQQNSEIEFNAYLDGSQDMTRVWGSTIAAGTGGPQNPTTVTTGAQYPSRMILINPAPPTGSITTSDTRTLTFSNVTATKSEQSNVQRYWNGSTQNYTTQFIRFRPSYNEFNAPPVHTSSVGTYRTVDDGLFALTGQSFINGNQITVVTIRGNMSATRQSVTVVPEPVSVTTQSVSVTGQGKTFNVTLPVPENASAWNNTSVADSIRRNPNVKEITPLPAAQAVRITLNGSQTYELKLARVVVHAENDEVSVSDPPATYITTETGNQTTVEPNSPHKLAVQVNDRFNNPRSGVNVTFTTDDGTFAAGDGTGSVTVSTTGAGHAAVSFIPDTSGPATVQAHFNGSTASLNTTTFELAVETPADINPNGTHAVSLQKVTSDSNNDLVNLTFNNTAPENRTIAKARISFYQGQKALANYGDLEGNSSDRLQIRDDFEPINQSIILAANDKTHVEIVFSSTNNQFDVRNDFFMLSVTYEEYPGTYTYFVAIPP